jgi:hypothetical protein
VTQGLSHSTIHPKTQTRGPSRFTATTRSKHVDAKYEVETYVDSRVSSDGLEQVEITDDDSRSGYGLGVGVYTDPQGQVMLDVRNRGYEGVHSRTLVPLPGDLKLAPDTEAFPIRAGHEVQQVRVSRSDDGGVSISLAEPYRRPEELRARGLGKPSQVRPGDFQVEDGVVSFQNKWKPQSPIQVKEQFSQSTLEALWSAGPSRFQGTGDYGLGEARDRFFMGGELRGYDLGDGWERVLKEPERQGFELAGENARQTLSFDRSNGNTVLEVQTPEVVERFTVDLRGQVQYSNSKEGPSRVLSAPQEPQAAFAANKNTEAFHPATYMVRDKEPGESTSELEFQYVDSLHGDRNQGVETRVKSEVGFREPTRIRVTDVDDQVGLGVRVLTDSKTGGLLLEVQNGEDSETLTKTRIPLPPEVEPGQGLQGQLVDPRQGLRSVRFYQPAEETTGFSLNLDFARGSAREQRGEFSLREGKLSYFEGLGKVSVHRTLRTRKLSEVWDAGPSLIQGTADPRLGRMRKLYLQGSPDTNQGGHLLGEGWRELHTFSRTSSFELRGSSATQRLNFDPKEGTVELLVCNGKTEEGLVIEKDGNVEDVYRQSKSELDDYGIRSSPSQAR